MDKLVEKIVALGVPGLVLLVAISASGWTGAAAITTALAALGGPLGMFGGIALLVVLALISRGLTEYGFEGLFKASVTKMWENGVSKEEIRRKLLAYPITQGLKARILYHLDKFEPEPPTRALD